MRGAVVDELTRIAEADQRLILLTGDLGFTVLETFRQRFPDRFINCGAAEQNMIGLATGLAEAGFIPFVYSIATFASLRPYEFIRNGPVAHTLPVRIIGIGGGFDYGHDGLTHLALEDFAVMRVQPGLTTIAPADGAQARVALQASLPLPGPVYFRIGKRGDPVPGLDGRFELGRLAVLREGSDVAILAIGSIAHEAVAAARQLSGRGIEATVAIVSSFNPSPSDEIAELLAGVPIALSVEAHYRVGGLGSLVAETIADRGLGCRLIRAGVAAQPRGESGGQNFLEAQSGLDAPTLAASVERACAR